MLRRFPNKKAFDTPLLTLPFAYIRSGNYHWNYSAIYGQGTHGYFWSQDFGARIAPYDLYFRSNTLNPTSINNISLGFSVRKQGNEQGRSNKDTPLLTLPFAYIRSGSYYWDRAQSVSRGGYGVYWAMTVTSYSDSYRLSFETTYLRPKSNYHKGHGFVVRQQGNQRG